ncbi:hypothetical protein [Arthrobacter sp. TMS2-4]
MTWTKLSDDFTDDCWSLSDAAYRLHSEGLVWSNRKLLDLLIPKEDVPRFAKHPEAVTELLDQRFWKDVGDRYLIRHHAQYQRTREAVIKQQDTNRQNGGKGGRPKGKGREQVGDVTQGTTQSLTEPLSESKTEPTTQWVKRHPGTEPVLTLASTRFETQSLTEPPGESRTERDRPGMYEEVPPNGSESNDHEQQTAIRLRKWIEEHGITTVGELAQKRGMEESDAQKAWDKAYPNGKAA